MLSVYKKQFTRSLSEPLVLDITSVGISGLTGSLFDPPQVTDIPDFEYTWNKEMSKLSISVDLRKIKDIDLLESCVIYVSIGGEKSIALVERYNGNDNRLDVSNYTGLELKPVVNHIILNLGQFKVQADFKTKRGKIGQFIQGNSRNEVKGSGMLSSVITGNSYHIYRDDFESYLSHEQAKTERNGEHRNTPWLNEKGEKKYHSRKVLELTDLNIWTSDISKTGRMDLELAYNTGVHHLALNGDITYNTWEIEDGIERKVKENQKISIKDYGLDNIDFDFTHLDTKGVGEAKKARIDFKLNKNNGLIEYTFTPDDGRGESYIIYNLKASVKTETSQGKGRYLASKLTLVSKGKYKYWQVEHMNRAYHDPGNIDTSYYIRPYNTENNSWSNKLFTIKTGLALAGTENLGAEIYKPVLKFQKAGESDWKEMPSVDTDPRKLDKESGLFFKASGFTSATSRDIISREGNKRLAEGKPYDPQWIEEIVKNQSKNSKGQGEVVVWEDIVGTRKYWIILEYYGKSNQSDKNETSSISVTLYPTDKNETTTWQPRKVDTDEPLVKYKIEVTYSTTGKVYSHEFVFLEEAKKQVDPYIKLSIDGTRVSNGSTIDLPRSTSHTLTLETESGNTTRRNYSLTFNQSSRDYYYKDPKYLGGVVDSAALIKGGSIDTDGTVPFETYVTMVGGWHVEFGTVTAMTTVPSFDPNHWRHIIESPSPVKALIKMRGPNPVLKITGNPTFNGLGAVGGVHITTNTYIQGNSIVDREYTKWGASGTYRSGFIIDGIHDNAASWNQYYDGRQGEMIDEDFKVVLGNEVYVPPGSSGTNRIGKISYSGCDQDGTVIPGITSELPVYLTTTSDYSISIKDVRDFAMVMPARDIFRNWYSNEIHYNTMGSDEVLDISKNIYPKFSKTAYAYIEWDDEIPLPNDNTRLNIIGESGISSLYSGSSWSYWSNKNSIPRQDEYRHRGEFETNPSVVGNGKWAWDQVWYFSSRSLELQEDVLSRLNYNFLYIGSFVLWVSDNNESGKIKIPMYLLESVSPLKVDRGEDTRIFLASPNITPPRSSTFLIKSSADSRKALDLVNKECSTDYSQGNYRDLTMQVSSSGDVSCIYRSNLSSTLDKVIHTGTYEIRNSQKETGDLGGVDQSNYVLGKKSGGGDVLLKEAIDYYRDQINSVTTSLITPENSTESDGAVRGEVFGMPNNTGERKSHRVYYEEEDRGEDKNRLVKIVIADIGIKDMRVADTNRVWDVGVAVPSRKVKYYDLSESEKEGLNLDYWESQAYDFFTTSFEPGKVKKAEGSEVYDLSARGWSNILYFYANSSIVFNWNSRNPSNPGVFDVSKEHKWNDIATDSVYGFLFQLLNKNTTGDSDFPSGHVIMTTRKRADFNVELSGDSSNEYNTQDSHIVSLYIAKVDVSHIGGDDWSSANNDNGELTVPGMLRVYGSKSNSAFQLLSSPSVSLDGGRTPSHSYDSSTGQLSVAIPKNKYTEKESKRLNISFDGIEIEFHITIPGDPNGTTRVRDF